MTSSPDREKLSDVDSSDDDDSNDSEDAIRRLLNLKLNAGQTADKKEKTKVRFQMDENLFTTLHKANAKYVSNL
jgi:AMMECR1 domain-containing protein